jgi:hypothetical protein
VLLAALKEVASSHNFRPEEYQDVVKLLAKVGVALERSFMCRPDDSDQISDEALTTSSSPAAGIEIQTTGQCTNATTSVRRQSQSQSQGNGGESAVPSTVGSPGSAPELSYLTNLSSGAGMAGYVGKMFGMSWLLRVREYCDRGGSGEE